MTPSTLSKDRPAFRWSVGTPARRAPAQRLIKCSFWGLYLTTLFEGESRHGRQHVPVDRRSIPITPPKLYTQSKDACQIVFSWACNANRDSRNRED